MLLDLESDAEDAIDYSALEKRVIAWKMSQRHVRKAQAHGMSYGPKTGRWNIGETETPVTADGNTRTHRKRYEQQLHAIIALSGGKVTHIAGGWTWKAGQRQDHYRVELPGRESVYHKSRRCALVAAVDVLKRGRSHLHGYRYVMGHGDQLHDPYRTLAASTKRAWGQCLQENFQACVKDLTRAEFFEEFPAPPDAAKRDRRGAVHRSSH